jgi:hypothetical protein
MVATPILVERGLIDNQFFRDQYLFMTDCLLNPDRTGLATSAVASGASERTIMNQTGHKKPMMVRRYIRDVL